MSLKDYGIRPDQMEDVIRIDPNEDYRFGDDQAYNSYPVRFPTVEFELLATDELCEIGDRIRSAMGYKPVYTDDGEAYAYYRFFLGLNGFTESMVDSSIMFMVENSESEDDEHDYEINLGKDEQEAIYQILSDQCEKYFNMTCDELLAEAEMEMRRDGVTPCSGYWREMLCEAEDEDSCPEAFANRSVVGHDPQVDHALVEIEVIATVRMTALEYDDLTADLYANRDYLAPYTYQSHFTGFSHAMGVIITAPGRRRLAVVLEGHAYPRYIGFVWTHQHQLRRAFLNTGLLLFILRASVERVEAAEQERMINIKSIVENLKLSASQTMDAPNIPVADQRKYIAML